MDRPVKIFGREPVAWTTLIEAVLMVAGVQFFDWSVEKVAVVVVCVNALFGIYTAYVTKDAMLGVIVGAVKALITAAIAFGVNVPDDRAALYIALVTAAVGFWQRSETAPLLTPTFKRVVPYYEEDPARLSRSKAA